ncbi:MAG: SCO family protein [Planctomycetes bacterium]|nr:SCO family protein [Planctomycetota bacterium]
MSTMVRVWLTVLVLAVGAYGFYSAWRIRNLAQEKTTADSGRYTPEDALRAFGPGSTSPIAVVPASHTTSAPAAEVSAEAVKPAALQDLAALKFTERSGREFSVAELKDRVWLGSYFFASCTGPCRQINVALSDLQKELSDKDVLIVSITVDPDNDTSEVLQRYAKAFEADERRWLFLTGDFSDIKQLCQSVFQMPIDKKVHTERLTLFDRRGKPRGTFNTAVTAQMITLRKQLEVVLKEPSGDVAGTQASAGDAEAKPAPAAGSEKRS